MMLLEYKECKEPAERLKLDSETEAESRKKDLKARTILVSTISDNKLEYVKECTNACDMINKFEKIYTNKSTVLQILCRGKIDEIKLEDYDRRIFHIF